MPESKKTGKTLPKGMGKTPAKAVAKKAEAKKPSTSYSPRAYVTGLRKEMYAVQGAESKKKSDARIAAKKAASRGPKAGSSVVSKVGKVAGKVAGRAKTVAREVRDIKTAVGTSLRDQEQNVRRAAMGVKPTGKNVGKNIRTQIKEVGTAIKSGKKGTSSDMYNKPGAYTKGTKRK
jgi:hypothetical protein